MHIYIKNYIYINTTYIKVTYTYIYSNSVLIEHLLISSPTTPYPASRKVLF